MRTDSNPVYILSSARIPFAKSQTAYAETSRQDLMVASLNSLVKKAGLKGKHVGDTALGAVINSAGDWNLARECLFDR
jgi:acetyl-CoA C-acetyltransferase